MSKAEERTIRELVKEMLNDYDSLVPGCDLPIITERNNTAGKILGAMKVRLVYAALRKEKPSIAFLDVGPQRKLGEGKK